MHIFIFKENRNTGCFGIFLLIMCAVIIPPTLIYCGIKYFEDFLGMFETWDWIPFVIYIVLLAILLFLGIGIIASFLTAFIIHNLVYAIAGIVVGDVGWLAVFTPLVTFVIDLVPTLIMAAVYGIVMLLVCMVKGRR